MRQSATKAEDIHSRLQTLERELSSLTGSLEVSLVCPLILTVDTRSDSRRFSALSADAKIARLGPALGHPPIPDGSARGSRHR